MCCVEDRSFESRGLAPSERRIKNYPGLSINIECEKQMVRTLTKSSKSCYEFRSTKSVAGLVFVLGFFTSSIGWAMFPLRPWEPQATTVSSDSLAQLRRDIDAWVGNGMAVDDFSPLAGRTRDLVERGTDPSELLSMLHESSRLCWHGPALATRALREWSLNQLLRMPSESGRTRMMLRSQFLPALHRVVPEKQVEEVEVFDQLVNKLVMEDLPEEFRADLSYARLLLRVEVNRAWNAAWLDQSERDQTIDSLRELAAAFEDVEAADGKKYPEIVAGDIRELRELAFGSPVPGFKLTDLQNVDFGLQDYRGKVVALVFWSSWCVPCLARVPEEKEMQLDLAGQPFELIGVNSDQSADQARKTAAQRSMSWRNVWDSHGRTSSLGKYFAIRGLPSAVVLDREGRICGKFVGSIFNQNFATRDVRRVVELALGKADGETANNAGKFANSSKMTEDDRAPATGKPATTDATLTVEELARYTEVAKQLITAINNEDKQVYRALFTDDAWESAIPWFRDMFAVQISSFGRIQTAYAPRRGLVRISEQMAFRGGSDQSATIMVKFENGMGGALSFELNSENKIISSNVFIKQELSAFADRNSAPVFELKQD
jgi:thiol-disulfide isomerase/thioredoxin